MLRSHSSTLRRNFSKYFQSLLSKQERKRSEHHSLRAKWQQIEFECAKIRGAMKEHWECVEYWGEKRRKPRRSCEKRGGKSVAKQNYTEIGNGNDNSISLTLETLLIRMLPVHRGGLCNTFHVFTTTFSRVVSRFFFVPLVAIRHHSSWNRFLLLSDIHIVVVVVIAYLCVAHTPIYFRLFYCLLYSQFSKVFFSSSLPSLRACTFCYCCYDTNRLATSSFAFLISAHNFLDG